MKSKILFIALLTGLLAATCSTEALAQAIELLANRVAPRVTIIADMSRSMWTSGPVAGANLAGCGPDPSSCAGCTLTCTRDCLAGDCDRDGRANRRSDVLVAVIRGLLDTDGSANTGAVPHGLGSPSSILGTGDNLNNIRFGLINFQGPYNTQSPLPREEDVPVTTGSCNSAIRYRIREANGGAYDPVETALKSFLGDGGTPTKEAIKYFRTNAMPWFEHQNALGHYDNDPDFLCRKQYILLVTDGDANCDTNPPNAAQDAAYVVAEGAALHALHTGQNQVRIFGVGFAGLSTVGEGMLRDLSSSAGGEAFFVDTAQELIAAMHSIIDQIGAGTYSISVPRLTLAGDGSGAVIASYFEVAKFPGYPAPWTPGLIENLLDYGSTPPSPIIPKWDAFVRVGAQPTTPDSTGPTNARRNYSLDSSTNGHVVPFNDDTIGTIFPTSAFFTPSVPNLDDFDSNTTPGDLDDAKNIGRFMNGVTTLAQGGTQVMRVQNNHPYDATKFPFGSIVHAQPHSVTRPSNPFLISRADYLQFVANNADRDRIVLVGTNTIIAAINDVEPGTTSSNGFGDGELLWGYVPRLNLHKYRAVNYETIMLNDGNGIAVDYNAGLVEVSGSTNWQSGFFTGLGQGGRGVVAINITNTRNPGAGTVVGNTFGNWEFTDGNLGFTTAPPTLIEVKDQDFATNHKVWPVIVMPGGLHDATDAANPNNGRYVYFINAVDGTSVRVDGSSNPLPVPLGLTGNATYDNRFSQYTVPAGTSTKAAPVDYNSDGYADEVYIGTESGQVYRIDFTDYQSLQSTSLVAETVWEPRVLAENGGLHGGGPVTCPSPGSDCDMQNPTDIRVASVLPYYDLNAHLRLAIYFGDPEGTNQANMATGSHPRGTILRFLSVDPLDGSLFNNEIRFNEDPLNDAKRVYNYLIDPTNPTGPGLESEDNGTLMPRQLYTDRVAGRADRLLSWPSMFVLDHKMYYMLYRPDASSCGANGVSYFACLNLTDGTDCNINPLNPGGTQNAANNSVENFLLVANSPASFIIDFATRVVTFAWADGTGINMRSENININGPFQGVLQSLIQTGMM